MYLEFSFFNFLFLRSWEETPVSPGPSSPPHLPVSPSSPLAPPIEPARPSPSPTQPPTRFPRPPPSDALDRFIYSLGGDLVGALRVAGFFYLLPSHAQIARRPRRTSLARRRPRRIHQVALSSPHDLRSPPPLLPGSAASRGGSPSNCLIVSATPPHKATTPYYSHLIRPPRAEAEMSRRWADGELVVWAKGTLLALALSPPPRRIQGGMASLGSREGCGHAIHFNDV